MNVWLLHVGEELPVDENPRLFRYAHLAERLVKRGHQVLRWAPTFQHFRKHQRFDCDTRVEVDDRYAIQFVHAPGYSRNISFARWKCYHTLGHRLRKMLDTTASPDLIVTGIPSLEWCEAVIDYGVQHNVPVVLDVRDLWPDVYLNALPRSLNKLGRLAIAPLRARVRRMCRRATAIYGVSQTYLDWGLRHAGREQSSQDWVIPLGYAPKELSDDEQQKRLHALVQQGVDPRKTICMFAGLIERLYDVESIVAAARILEQQFPGKYQFVICGKGSKSARISRLAKGTHNVVPLGWVDQQMIAALMSISKIGLATYTAGAPQSLPNKPFEYMAGGLAVVTSLPGELPALLAQHDCGTTYRAGDAADLAQAIVQLTHNPRRLAAQQANSRRLFALRFDAAQVYEAFCDSLTELVSSEVPAPRIAA